MQISSTPTAYGGNEAQRLLNMLLQQQKAPAGQDLPGVDSTTAATTPAPQPTSSPDAAQFASDTLASLLSAQEAPPSSSDVASKVIGAADANGDGKLSTTELSAGIDAFRAAHHRGGSEATQSQSAQVVTA